MKIAKLPHLDRMNEERRRIAEKYLLEIKDPAVILPTVNKNTVPVWHVFAVRCKEQEDHDKLEKWLTESGIGTNKHYPIPMHLQECYRDLEIERGKLPIAEEISRTELSLPMYYGMTDDEIDYVINMVNIFKGE